MKTAKEILNHHYSFVDDLDEIEYNDLLSMITFAQDNAYNQAIDDVDNLIDNHQESFNTGLFPLKADHKSD